MQPSCQLDLYESGVEKQSCPPTFSVLPPRWLCSYLYLFSTITLVLMYFCSGGVGWLVGWLMFNDTFSTARLYRAMSAQELNPVIYLLQMPCVGFRVVRTDPLHFLARCCTRRLNQALSVLSLSLGFFWLYMLCVISGLFRLCYFYVICVFYRLVVLVKLSVPVQMID